MAKFWQRASKNYEIAGDELHHLARDTALSVWRSILRALVFKIFARPRLLLTGSPVISVAGPELAPAEADYKQGDNALSRDDAHGSRTAKPFPHQANIGKSD